MSQLPEIFDQQINDIADPAEIRSAFNSIRSLLNNGIETDNIKDSAVTDAKIGTRTINDSIAAPTGNTDSLSTLISQLARQIKVITGKAAWYTQPTYTINQIEQIAASSNNKSDNAVSTANSASSKADTAINTADSAVNTANTADANAATALNKAKQVESDYAAIKPTIEKARDDAQAAVAAVANKVDKAYVDQVAADFTIGVVADGSITEAKLAFQAATQSELDTHSSNDITHIFYGEATGSANAYAVTLSPAPAAYADGMAVSLKINVDATAAATLNVNGLGAKALKKANGNNITNLKGGGIYTFRYNAATGNFIVQGEGATGNATASDLLSGKTATTDAGEIVGTMPTKAAATITPSTVNQTIAANQYLTGIQTITGDADLIASNIKSGVNIFGVTGSVIQASGSAVAAQVLNGVTASNSSGAITGTMPDRTGGYVVADNISPYEGTLYFHAPQGYYDGGSNAWLYRSDSGFSAANIKSGVSIFGLSGTYAGNRGAGTTIVASHDAQAAAGSYSYTKLKEITVSKGGAYRVYFDLAQQYIQVGFPVTGRIYVNDVAVGTIRSSESTTFVTYAEDIVVADGARIQIYGTANFNVSGLVKNFRLGIDIGTLTNTY